jgi:hypothetical protein
MNQYQFKILDPRRIGQNPEDVKFSNQLYQTWTQAFSKVVVEAGGTLDPDDYFRNDFALIIFDQQKILGFSMCTEFDLRLKACQDHHYWRAMQPETIRKLQGNNIHRLMSMEYFTVLPDWRQVTRRQVSWAEVIVGLGLLYQDQFPIDAMVGTPRADIRISGLSARMGGVPVQEPIMKMNYPCSVHVFSKIEVGTRHFANPLTEKWSHELWNQKEDLRISKNQTAVKKAA